jgi:hypothetical protein
MKHERLGKTYIALRQAIAVEADTMSASVDSEALAIRVRDGLVAFRSQFEKWLPLAIELHSRFEVLKQEKTHQTILGCSTWAQFCVNVLDYSERHMRRLMEGANPAVKYRNKTATIKKTVALPTSTVAVPLARNCQWTDNEYVRSCVGFVESTLRPLESDPQRFHRVAVAIAREIAGDMLGDEESDDRGLVEHAEVGR